jgi:hypothetical protein
LKLAFAIVLTTSLVANVALALRVAGSSTALPAGTVDVTLPVMAASTDDEAGKAATLLALERRYFAGAKRAAARYWVSNGEFEREYQEALRAAERSIRSELVRIYGADAELDPVFAHLFRPLDPVFSFLTSAQQLAVQQLKLDRESRLQRALRREPVSSGTAMTLPEGMARPVEEAYQDGLSALLDAKLLFEFQLRDSSVARQLRGSPVDFTEQEFRQVFRIMQALHGSTAGIDGLLAAREELRGILGDGRFARFWAARDPAFAGLQRTADRLAIPEASMLSVYEVLHDFQDRQMRSARSASENPARAVEESAALRDEERRAIAGIVGAELADEILRARAAENYQFFKTTGNGVLVNE